MFHETRDPNSAESNAGSSIKRAVDALCAAQRRSVKTHQKRKIRVSSAYNFNMADLPPGLDSAFKTILDAQNSLTKPNERLEHALTNSKKKGLPAIAIGPSQGSYLSILCQLIGAKSVLEIGTLGGYSTIWFANSRPDVKVTSIEFNAKHRDVALENMKGLSNVEILLGAALDVLPKLASEGRMFDFVFIDADWDEQQQYFDWAVKMTRKGGCIYVDNAVRQLTDNAAEGTPERGMALIEHLQKDKRVEASLMPTLNTHHTTLDAVVDGFVIAIVK